MHNFATKQIRIAFRDYLLTQVTCTFLGFIGKSKNDSDVIHFESLNPNEYTATNHYIEIKKKFFSNTKLFTNNISKILKIQ